MTGTGSGESGRNRPWGEGQEQAVGRVAGTGSGESDRNRQWGEGQEQAVGRVTGTGSWERKDLSPSSDCKANRC